MTPSPALLADPYGRPIRYLRLSVTDRCDFRCVYCMAEDMTFLSRAEILSLEELNRLARLFIGQGVTKLRLTGGEPLVRKGVIGLVESLGKEVRAGRLAELTLTTNGSRLAEFAHRLKAAGMRRINVSLDSLDPRRFRAITRFGTLEKVLDGLAAARDAGLAVKINTVALKGVNEDELDALIAWCGTMGFDLTLIEAMPLGDVEGDRTSHYLPLDQVRRRLEARWTLIPSTMNSGGPARYLKIAETGRRLGFITPLTHNFCEACNRVRLTCTGRLYMCLGQEDFVDLKDELRAQDDDARMIAAIRAAIARKPKGHDFIIEHGRPALARHMSVTGG